MNLIATFVPIIVIYHSLCCVSSKNVLVLLPVASKSHKNVFEPIVHGLAERNHTVTVVSAFAPSKERRNIREIVPNDFADSVKVHFANPFILRSKGALGLLSSFSSFEFLFDACHQTLRHGDFQALEKEKFDLVFMDAFMNDCLDGFIYKTGAPLILVAPLAAPGYTIQVTGNRLPPSFVPSPMLALSDDMNFLERLKNTVFLLLTEFVSQFFFIRKFERIYKHHYVDEDLPGVDEILKNVSMIFTNSHFSLTFPRPLLPVVVEVGGMHCRPPMPLPKELEDFAAGAKDGLILFSLGSIVQAKDMPDEVRRKFLNVFSRLKQRVLWKWETEEMQDLPSNVKLSKWLPQQDILGHPNTKLFMTHGGLLSTQEATYHGVPLIGIPIFGDQDLNMKQAEHAGYARTIEILEMTEESLERTIREILSNHKYSERAQYLSSIFRDQLETPLERAIFWTEYVMRHRGAHHLKSAARELNFIQYYSIDVVAVLLVILIILLWSVKLIVLKLLKVICFKKVSKLKKVS